MPLSNVSKLQSASHEPVVVLGEPWLPKNGIYEPCIGATGASEAQLGYQGNRAVK